MMYFIMFIFGALSGTLLTCIIQMAKEGEEK